MYRKTNRKSRLLIPVKGSIIRAEESSNDMYVSIDLVEEIIERQLRKYKNKLIDKKQSAQSFSDLFISEEAEPEDEIQIVKTKRFAMKPMDPEEACVQMELLGHNFYVFLNAETEEVNVVYKRKGLTYGLIEPSSKLSYFSQKAPDFFPGGFFFCAILLNAFAQPLTASRWERTDASSANSSIGTKCTA